MLKQLHRVFCVIIFAGLLAFAPCSFAIGDDGLKANPVAQTTFEQKDIKVNDLDIEPMNTKEVKKTVVPDVKKEGRKVMFNFLKAMLLVFFASIIIYLVLLFVKKYYGSAFVTHEDDEYFETLDLETPDNRPKALKSFLNRTK